MPALGVSIPSDPRFNQLKDSVDKTDRGFEETSVMVSRVQAFVAGVRAPGAAAYQMPSNIPSGSRATYETAVDNINTAIATIQNNLIAITGLQPAP